MDRSRTVNVPDSYITNCRVSVLPGMESHSTPGPSRYQYWWQRNPSCVVFTTVTVSPRQTNGSSMSNCGSLKHSWHMYVSSGSKGVTVMLPVTAVGANVGGAKS